LVVFYIIGLYIHINTLNNRIKKINHKYKKLRKKYRNVKKNRDGLISQFELDKEEKQKLKEDLYRQTTLHYAILQEALYFVPKSKIFELSKKIELVKEISNIDHKNENSKNN